MSAYINTRVENSAGVGAKAWIPLNSRWSPTDYMVQTFVTGAATYDIEGTLAKINQGEAAEPFAADDAGGTPITGQTTSEVFELRHAPLEAIRVNQTAGAGSVAIRVFQAGSKD